jgi:hypothetical protein
MRAPVAAQDYEWRCSVAEKHQSAHCRLKNSSLGRHSGCDEAILTQRWQDLVDRSPSFLVDGRPA